MAYTPLRLSIPAPCNEDWDRMTPSDPNRRHCASCAKHVTDFSWMTDREIHQYFQRHGGKLCGRFRADQLDRPIRAYVPPASGWKWLAAAGGLLLSVGVQGQAVAPAMIVDPLPAAEQPRVGAVESTRSVVERATYRGQVVDEDGEPLIGVSVLVVGTETGTVTDLEGEFKLTVPPGRQITLSYVGYEARTLLAADLEGDLDAPAKVIRLLPAVSELQEIVVVGGLTHTMGMATGGISVVTTEEMSEEASGPSVISTAPQAFPNPFVSDLAVTFTAEAAGSIRADLFDLHGRLLHRWPVRPFASGEVQLPFSLSQLRLPAGDYILRMTDQDGAVESLIVTKQ